MLKSLIMGRIYAKNISFSYIQNCVAESINTTLRIKISIKTLEMESLKDNALENFKLCL